MGLVIWVFLLGGDLSQQNVGNLSKQYRRNLSERAGNGLDRRRLGYIRGDKSRLVMLATSDFDVKIKSGKFSAGDLGPGVNRATSNVTVLIDFEWDIQLFATRGTESDTETKEGYIKVI